MGLLDVLNGMQNGPRGQPQPAAPGSGGMSKTTMALLAFLAYKAFKSMNPQQPAQAGVPSPYPGGQDREPQEPGGLAGVLRIEKGSGPQDGAATLRNLPVSPTIGLPVARIRQPLVQSWVAVRIDFKGRCKFGPMKISDFAPRTGGSAVQTETPRRRPPPRS